MNWGLVKSPQFIIIMVGDNMEYLSSFDTLVNSLLIFLGSYGFIVFIIFGIMHPLFENPLSLLNMAMAFTVLGIPLGFLVVFSSNLVGIILLYYLAMKFNQNSNYFLFRHKVSKKVLLWIKTTPTWKHILVIGVPMIPTYPIKVGVPLSGSGFRKYLITLVGAYLFLYFGNFLIYFGALGIITNNIPTYLSFSLLLLFVLYLYFGSSFFNKLNIFNKKETI